MHTYSTKFPTIHHVIQRAIRKRYTRRSTRHNLPSNFLTGHEVPVQHQKVPGLESKLDPAPIYDQLPTGDGKYQPYKAAGKLSGKRALITGGDSGIGRSIAILYAMEGASSLIAYLPEEEEDAQETKRLVEAKGGKIWLKSTDLKERGNCKDVVEAAVEKLGGLDVLVNNHAYQMMVEDIKDLDE